MHISPAVAGTDRSVSAAFVDSVLPDLLAHYRLQRLAGVPNVFASPVGAADRVYIPGREGTTLVIRRGPKFEVLSSNTLDDGFDASPALAGRDLYLRGHTYLYAIAEP